MWLLDWLPRWVKVSAVICWVLTLAGIVFTFLDPGAINMAIGAGCWAIVFTILAILHRRDDRRFRREMTRDEPR